MQEGAIKDVQQSKIPDARRDGRNPVMADQPYVAHGSDNGSRGKGLPASVHTDKNTSRPAHVSQSCAGRRVAQR